MDLAADVPLEHDVFYVYDLGVGLLADRGEHLFKVRLVEDRHADVAQKVVAPDEDGLDVAHERLVLADDGQEAPDHARPLRVADRQDDVEFGEGGAGHGERGGGAGS